MTNELAIRILTGDVLGTASQTSEAIKMAVKALSMPSAQPEVIKCRDCEHQISYFYEDKRIKDGGYYIYGCELPNDYSHICFDDDFCSRAERKEE